ALKAGEVVYDGPSDALTPEFLGSIYGAESDDLFASFDARPVRPTQTAEPYRPGAAGPNGAAALDRSRRTAHAAAARGRPATRQKLVDQSLQQQGEHRCRHTWERPPWRRSCSPAAWRQRGRSPPPKSISA